MLSALVEEAVSVGDLVRLFTFRQGEANLVELTLPQASPLRRQPGRRRRLARTTSRWSRSCATAASSRPPPDDPIEAGDELLFVAASQAEQALQHMLSPHQGHDHPHLAEGRPDKGQPAD